MNPEPEPPKILPFQPTDWKSCVKWGVERGLIRFPMHTPEERVIPPDFSPDLLAAVAAKEKELREKI